MRKRKMWLKHINLPVTANAKEIKKQVEKTEIVIPIKPGEHPNSFFSKNLRPRNKLKEIHQTSNIKISNGNRSSLERIYDTIKVRDVFNNSVYDEFEDINKSVIPVQKHQVSYFD